jgi:hypothetical protein
MVSLHQARALPWSIIVEYHRQRKGIDGKRIWSASVNGELEHTPAFLKRVDHFAGRLEKVLNEFASTESAKHDRNKVDSMKKLYPDSAIDDILVGRFQTVKGWTDWIGEHGKALRTGTSEGGELCDIVKELFNRDMMAPLLHLARNVRGIERLSFITYSNFFHYGYRRVLEDALTCYLLLNYLVASDMIFEPGGLPRSLDRFTMVESHDASLTYYRKLIGNYDRDGISDGNIGKLQSFSFRCLYQYHLFWDAVCGRSRAERIDWRDEVRLCLASIL